MGDVGFPYISLGRVDISRHSRESGNPEAWSVAKLAIAMIVYMPEISNVSRT